MAASSTVRLCRCWRKKPSNATSGIDHRLLMSAAVALDHADSKSAINCKTTDSDLSSSSTSETAWPSKETAPMSAGRLSKSGRIATNIS
jgi:hypothetical protein